MRPFQRQPASAPGATPPEFRWVSVKMEVTTWVITIGLSMIGLGVWNGGHQLKDLVNAVTIMKVSDAKQDQVNERQDSQIKTLEINMAKQQGYLEQILEAVRSGERRLQQ